MPSGGYEDMGPRIDLDAQPEESGYMHQTRHEPPSPNMPGPLPSRSQSSGGKGLTLVSLVVALLALVVGLWALFSQPDAVSGPPLSPEVVPGGAAERVAKLEKDVSQLMLRLVTLEKELQSLANKAGTVSQLTELTSKVAALQDRLDALTIDQRMASLAKNRNKAAAPKPAEPSKAKTETKPEPKPKPAAAKPPAKKEKKKLTYTVRRGDTLFTVAQRYKVRMSDIKKWNNIKKGDILKIGEKLVIYK
jgi:LysM repeat protein